MTPVSPDDWASRVEHLLDEEVPGPFPGVAVVVVDRGAIILQACRGLADLETQLPITTEIAFDLGSVSKQFTAVAILMLMERGQLRLHDRVDKHLPEWWGYGSGRPLVLTDLLCHTSGLPNYSEIWQNSFVDDAETNADYLDRLRLHPQHFPAGSLSDYSNSNYILLAEVVERITGRTLRRFLADEVFLPLGLTNTHVQDTPEFPVPWRAHGYKRLPGGGYAESERLIHLVGHSHLFSTAADLGRYYQALWSHRFLSPDTLASAISTGRLDNGGSNIYAYGWYDDSEGGRKSVGHGGYWDGFKSYVRRFPQEDVTIVVLSNDEDRDVTSLVNNLASIFLPKTK